MEITQTPLELNYLLPIDFRDLHRLAQHQLR